MKNVIKVDGGWTVDVRNIELAQDDEPTWIGKVTITGPDGIAFEGTWNGNPGDAEGELVDVEAAKTRAERRQMARARGRRRATAYPIATEAVLEQLGQAIARELGCPCEWARALA